MQMRILKISPGLKPECVTVPTGLKSLQQMVDGYIEAFYPYADSVGFVCNEEGKLLGLEPNRAVRNEETNEIMDIVCGTFLICGLGQEDFCSLTEEQIEKYSKMFEQPELFLWNGRQLIIIPAGI